jgi:hypothetical protein
MPIIAAFLALVGVVGVAVAIVLVGIYLGFMNPDKTERWAELLYALFARFNRGANRRAVKHGTQARMDAFSTGLAKEIGQTHATKVDIQWTGPDEEPNHFFADKRLVIRLHAHERQDRNDVTSSMFIVSQTLVRRAKRFLSKTQARSIDLFAVDRQLTRLAPSAADLFHEEILGPEVDADPELGQLLIEYQRIDKVKAFFPVFIRELNYLGQKVVVRPRNESLIDDVKHLQRFLCRYSDRKIGEEIEMGVHGKYLRCAVMIVAKTVKRELGNPAPYVAYLNRLENGGYETVYLVGSTEFGNREFINGIVREFLTQSGWSMVDRRDYNTILHDHDGFDREVPNMLIVLRSNQLKDYVGEAAEIDAFDEPPRIAS